MLAGYSRPISLSPDWSQSFRISQHSSSATGLYLAFGVLYVHPHVLVIHSYPFSEHLLSP